MKTRVSFLASLLIAAALCGSAGAQQYKAGTLEVKNPWSRATAQGAKVGAGFLEIVNKGDKADRLISVSTDASARGEIHEMTMRDGVMHMRPLANGIPVPPGKTVSLAPGGLHLMFVDLKEPLKQGQKLKATLVFEQAGKLDVEFAVQSIGARGTQGGNPPRGHHHH